VLLNLFSATKEDWEFLEVGTDDNRRVGVAEDQGSGRRVGAQL
jgi:hypothetical protein